MLLQREKAVPDSNWARAAAYVIYPFISRVIQLLVDTDRLVESSMHRRSLGNSLLYWDSTCYSTSKTRIIDLTG